MASTPPPHRSTSSSFSYSFSSTSTSSSFRRTINARLESRPCFKCADRFSHEVLTPPQPTTTREREREREKSETHRHSVRDHRFDNNNIMIQERFFNFNCGGGPMGPESPVPVFCFCAFFVVFFCTPTRDLSLYYNKIPKHVSDDNIYARMHDIMII